MGTAEYIAVVMAFLVPAIGWLFTRVMRHDTDVAVIKVSLSDHEPRLRALEKLASDLTGDMREVRNDVHRLLGLVEGQSKK